MPEEGKTAGRQGTRRLPGHNKIQELTPFSQLSPIPTASRTRVAEPSVGKRGAAAPSLAGIRLDSTSDGW